MSGLWTACGVSPHPTHAHLARVLEWVERVSPRRTILTHMSHETDYARLRSLCPPSVEPAYDGMEITVGAVTLSGR